MSETTYCQRNKLVILNRTKRYYHDNIKLLREKAKNKYRELSEEEIIKKENMEEIDILICLKERKKN